MAHFIEPVTRQRDDKARLAYRSRLWSLVLGGLRSACACGSPRLPQCGHDQMEGVVAPFIWSRTGKRKIKRERKGLQKRCEKRRNESRKCFSGRRRLMTRVDLSKERAVLGQVDEFGEVFSYC
ncbi:hypothetical protein DER46DRAFT_397797 [Fusarium sp. MPI-SDFR-AT-0072]|nr:hypothetical protein DER46DRAFT_397797 [Fusarium sp. MPI-SDFR-AT-0072]